jgi:hypothetical protein
VYTTLFLSETETANFAEALDVFEGYYDKKCAIMCIDDDLINEYNEKCE